LAKLKATNVEALIADYETLSGDDAFRLIGRALTMSGHVLHNSAKPFLAGQLAGHLVGRLRMFDLPAVHDLVASFHRCPYGPRLIPQTPSLIPASGIHPLQPRIFGELDPVRPMGHDGRVWSVAVLPGNRQALSASRQVKLWDLVARKEVWALGGHEESVLAMAALPDGRRVATACRDRMLRLVDLQDGQLIRTFPGHEQAVTAVVVMPDGRRLLSASSDRTLRLWDSEDGRQIRVFPGHGDSVLDVSVLPDGRRALSASADRTLRLWDLDTGETLRTYGDATKQHILSTLSTGHQSYVSAVAVLPDGRRAISGSADCVMRLWDLETGETIRTFNHLGEITGLAMLPDGRRALSGSFHTDPLWHTIRLWDLDTGSLVTVFTPDGGVLCVAAAGDDLFIAGDDWGAVHILRLVK
jgi:WD40 repeat protein